MKINIDRAHVYSLGAFASLMILDVIYDIEDKVRIAYVVDDTIIGYITTKKIYSLNGFITCLLYNKEYTQEARKTK